LGDNNLIGAAWVFISSTGVWTQQAKLVGADSTPDTEQGRSAALSGDGNMAIVGGPIYDSSGAAWVYARAGGVWSQQAKLVGTGAIGDALQGISVSLSADGNTAIVGGFGDNNDAGAAWVYSEFVFPGTPGTANCLGQRVSALAGQYGGLNAAAAALGFASVAALQNAIMAYCGG
jgi:hypothetical protein